ncbi:hypothetical protein CARUB_v10011062mg, partial [Capsella rubella]
TESEWDSLVIKSKLPVMVMFVAHWCGPCRVSIPILNKFAWQYKNKFKFDTVDIDSQVGISSRYHITRLPTTIVFKGGVQVARVTQFSEYMLDELVKKYM